MDTRTTRSSLPTEAGGVLVFAWILAIHVTALVGLVMYPRPGWRLLLGSTMLVFLGGQGATICYHRALAHRSVRLRPVVQWFLIFFAMLAGVTPPRSWIPNHRFHHAIADRREDPSSPVWHGLWFAHVVWYWQPDVPIPAKYGADLETFSLRIWGWLTAPIYLLAFFGGALVGLRGFFWLGAIRLAFAFQANSLVNSICHTQPGVIRGRDSSRNVWWVGLPLLFLGENWHRNHHTVPTSARLGWNWRQADLGYLMIVGLEKLGLATDVRRLVGTPRRLKLPQPCYNEGVNTPGHARSSLPPTRSFKNVS
jgi:fatty-acid desaturase